MSLLPRYLGRFIAIKLAYQSFFFLGKVAKQESWHQEMETEDQNFKFQLMNKLEKFSSSLCCWEYC